MPELGIPETVKEFLFEYIDSIDQLEVLLFMHANRGRDWTAHQVSDQLRTNPELAALRLMSLHATRLLILHPKSPPSYQYDLSNFELARAIDELAEAYKTYRYRIYELIFSSLKQARKFLDTFTVPDKRKPQ